MKRKTTGNTDLELTAMMKIVGKDIKPFIKTAPHMSSYRKVTEY
jgi:hypothetical protein